MLPQSQQQESSVLMNLSSDINVGTQTHVTATYNTLPGLVTQAGLSQGHAGGVRLPGFQKEKEMGTMILYSVMLRHEEETFSYP